MNRTKNQIRHFLLSFPDEVLINWYNDVVLSPWEDFSEQCIRKNTTMARNYIKSILDLEVLIKAAKNEKTRFSAGEKYFCLTGGYDPYLLSFDTFEEFLKTEAGEALVGWLTGSDELLDELPKMAE